MYIFYMKNCFLLYYSVRLFTRENVRARMSEWASEWKRGGLVAEGSKRRREREGKVGWRRGKIGWVTVTGGASLIRRARARTSTQIHAYTHAHACKNHLLLAHSLACLFINQQCNNLSFFPHKVPLSQPSHKEQAHDCARAGVCVLACTCMNAYVHVCGLWIMESVCQCAVVIIKNLKKKWKYR